MNFKNNYNTYLDSIFEVPRQKAVGKSLFFGRVLEATDSKPLNSIVVGIEPLFDLHTYDPNRIRSIRLQKNRAINKSVKIVHNTGYAVMKDFVLKNEVRKLVELWQKSKNMPPMSFAAKMPFIDQLEHHDLFLARRGNELVGVLFVCRQYAREKVLFEYFVRDVHTPNGTNEFLFFYAFEFYRQKQVQFISLGLCPCVGLAPFWLKIVGHCTRGLYDFSGLYQFKKKFQPTEWKTVLYEYNGYSLGTAIFLLLRAFAKGSYSQFFYDYVKLHLDRSYKKLKHGRFSCIKFKSLFLEKSI